MTAFALVFLLGLWKVVGSALLITLCAIPGVLMFLLLYWVDGLIVKLYDTHYWVNMAFDRVFHHRIRSLSRFLTRVLPAVFIWWCFFTGLALDPFKSLWAMQTDAQVTQQKAAEAPKLLSDSVMTFTITAQKPPKGYYVSLKDDQGWFYNDIWVSSQCPAWSTNHVGDKVNLHTQLYQNPDGSRYIHLTDIYQVLCN